MVLVVSPRVDGMNPKTFSISFKVVNAEESSTSYIPPGTVAVRDAKDDRGGNPTGPVTCRVVSVTLDYGIINGVRKTVTVNQIVCD